LQLRRQKFTKITKSSYQKQGRASDLWFKSVFWSGDRNCFRLPHCIMDHWLVWEQEWPNKRAFIPLVEVDYTCWSISLTELQMAWSSEAETFVFSSHLVLIEMVGRLTIFLFSILLGRCCYFFW
jgi:hypothetical protein